MHIFLRQWVQNCSLKEDLLRVMPVWVKFPQLPLHLWGYRSIGKIASAIGKPLFADDCTDQKLRVSYPKVMIEVDVKKDL